MFNRAAMKQRVRQTLKNTWGPAFGMLFVYGLLSGLATYVGGLFGAISPFVNGIIRIAVLLLLTCPMSFGISRYFLMLSRGERPTIGDGFSWYSALGKSISGGLWHRLWNFIWTFVGEFIAIFIATFFAHALFGNYAVSSTLDGFAGLFDIFLSFYNAPWLGWPDGIVNQYMTMIHFGVFGLWYLAFFVGLIPAFIKELSYSQYYYILCDHPEMGVRDALNLSKKMMRGHKGELFVLRLSFILWILGTIFTCGLLGIYFDPYANTVYAAYYDELKRIGFANGSLRPDVDFGEAVYVQDPNFYNPAPPQGGYAVPPQQEGTITPPMPPQDNLPQNDPSNDDDQGPTFIPPM